MCELQLFFLAQEGSGAEVDVPTLLTVDGGKANPQIHFDTNSVEATVDDGTYVCI